MTAPTYTSTSTMPRNSASSSSQITALLKKHSTSSSAQCTGFRARITPSAAQISTDREYEEQDGREHQRYRASAARSAAIMAS